MHVLDLYGLSIGQLAIQVVVEATHADGGSISFALMFEKDDGADPTSDRRRVASQLMFGRTAARLDGRQIHLIGARSWSRTATGDHFQCDFTNG